MNKDNKQNKIKEFINKHGKKKVTITIGVVVLVILLASVALFNFQPKETVIHIEQLKVEIEYSSDGEPVDPFSLVQITRENDEIKLGEKDAYVSSGLKATCYPKVIDTSKTGLVNINFTIIDEDNHNSTQKATITFKVVDSSAPEFELKKDKVTVTVGDEFDPASYIKDAHDAKLVEEEPKKNEDGSYDYSWYTITSNVKTKKAGNYSVKYHVVGTSGVVSDIELKVTVEEAKKEESDTSSTKTESKKTTKSSKTNTVSESNSTTAANSSQSTSKVSNSTPQQSTGGDVYNGKEQTSACKTTKVHHDAVTKENTYQVWIVDQPASTKSYLRCTSCGACFDTQDEMIAHVDEMEEQDDFSHTWEVVTEPVPEQGHYETKTETIIITPAYDEDICK